MDPCHWVDAEPQRPPRGRVSWGGGVGLRAQGSGLRASGLRAFGALGAAGVHPSKKQRTLGGLMGWVTCATLWVRVWVVASDRRTGGGEEGPRVLNPKP